MVNTKAPLVTLFEVGHTHVGDKISDFGESTRTLGDVRFSLESNERHTAKVEAKTVVVSVVDL